MGVYEIKLLVETDDDAEAEALSAAVRHLACPVDDFEDHVCRVPWFVMAYQLSDDEAAEVRDLLNR